MMAKNENAKNETASVEDIIGDEPKAKTKQVPKGSIRNRFESGPVRINGVELAPLGSRGDTVKLNDDQLSDSNFMAVIFANNGNVIDFGG